MKLSIFFLLTQIFVLNYSFATETNQRQLSPGTLFEVVGIKGTIGCPRSYPDPNCPVGGYPISAKRNALNTAYHQCAPNNNKAIRVSDWTVLGPNQVTAKFMCVPLLKPGSVVEGYGEVYIDLSLKKRTVN